MVAVHVKISSIKSKAKSVKNKIKTHIKKLHVHVKTKTIGLVNRYGNHIGAGVFVSGFVLDFFGLPGMNNPLTKWLGIIYIIVLAGAILLRTITIKARETNIYAGKVVPYATLAIAFFSGSLLSYVFVLYFRSASLDTSWLFFLVLFGMIVINEYVTRKKERLFLDLLFLYTSITFALIYIIPFFSGNVDNFSFIFALILAGILCLFFSFLVEHVSGYKLFKEKNFYILSIVVPAVILSLFVFRLIPPIPVTVVHSGVYHLIYRNPDGTYSLSQEKEKVSMWKKPTYNFKLGQMMYFFSSVAAPASIKAPITHTWEWFNKETKVWEIKTQVAFPIIGGRKAGYRGYSISSNVISGSWRVTVALGTTRIIDRAYFSVNTYEGKLVPLEMIKG